MAGNAEWNQNTNYLANIRKIIKLQESMLKEYVCQKYGLTLPEATVISFLHNNPGKDTAADIVELRMLQKSNVSQAVEALVKKSLLMREQDGADRRKIHLSLTENAEEIIQALERMRGEFHREIFRGITEEERMIFARVNARMAENVQLATEKRGQSKGEKKNEGR